MASTVQRRFVLCLDKSEIIGRNEPNINSASIIEILQLVIDCEFSPFLDSIRER